MGAGGDSFGIGTVPTRIDQEFEVCDRWRGVLCLPNETGSTKRKSRAGTSQ